MNNDDLKIIAFYLPQYHPTEHNNKWWGEGFTEWTNVAKARKLYPGHYQPKVPADLGFYDLRLPDVRQRQAELAAEAGIYGFCYYHYWFSEGHEELDMPFKEVVRTKSPDLPFCLCWANESWYSKLWNKDGSAEKRLLAEQLYPGAADNEAHFRSLLQAFKDERYIKVDGKLLFMIYQPLQFEDFAAFKEQWNRLAAENGLPGFFFVGQVLHTWQIDAVKEKGFDAVNHCHRLDGYYRDNENLKWIGKAINFVKRFIKIPFIIPYCKAISKATFAEDRRDDVFPTMMPNWDHTPRSGRGGSVLHNSTPGLFERHAEDVISTTSHKDGGRKIVFLKSWNEWGEGNYMEPDLKFGHGYIDALRHAIVNSKKETDR